MVAGETNRLMGWLQWCDGGESDFHPCDWSGRMRFIPYRTTALGTIYDSNIDNLCRRTSWWRWLFLSTCAGYFSPPVLFVSGVQHVHDKHKQFSHFCKDQTIIAVSCSWRILCAVILCLLDSLDSLNSGSFGHQEDTPLRLSYFLRKCVCNLKQDPARCKHQVQGEAAWRELPYFHYWIRYYSRDWTVQRYKSAAK